MPEFIQNVSRIPKQGKNFDVTEGSIDLIKGLNQNGNVSFTISTPPAFKNRVISALTFDTLGEIEAFHDGFLENDQSRDKFQKVAADCEDVNISIIRNVRQPEVFSPDAKYMIRTIMVAKRGEAPNLLETVLEMADSSKTMDPLISVPMFGSPDVVRIVNGINSLEDVNSIIAEVNGESFAPFRSKVSSLTVRMFRTLSRIAYRTGS